MTNNEAMVIIRQAFTLTKAGKPQVNNAITGTMIKHGWDKKDTPYKFVTYALLRAEYMRANRQEMSELGIEGMMNRYTRQINEGSMLAMYCDLYAAIELGN